MYQPVTGVPTTRRAGISSGISRQVEKSVTVIYPARGGKERGGQQGQGRGEGKEGEGWTVSETEEAVHGVFVHHQAQAKGKRQPVSKPQRLHKIIWTTESAGKMYFMIPTNRTADQIDVLVHAQSCVSTPPILSPLHQQIYSLLHERLGVVTMCLKQHSQFPGGPAAEAV